MVARDNIRPIHAFVNSDKNSPKLPATAAETELGK